MRERIPTLLFYASGVPRWSRIASDTLRYGLRLPLEKLHSRLPPDRFLFLLRDEYGVLSYVYDWLEAFRQYPGLNVTACNVNNLIEYSACLRRLKNFPFIVVLHSAAGDNVGWIRRAARHFRGRRGKLVLFFGNEYTLMPEKISFAREVEADYIASQLPLAASQWLYASCIRSAVLPVPPALNPHLYQPSNGQRPIDVGFRGELYDHMLLGDMERTTMLRLFQERASDWGLAADIAFSRLPREQWSSFLNACKGIVGAESGTYYLERDDRTQRAVQQYARHWPEANWEEVFEKFYRPYTNPVSAKAISSRHFEPIGTKTCQILLEGKYNDILRADEHYISIKRDFSNVDDAVRRFKDETYRREMVDRTYEYVLTAHTYAHRVRALVEVVFP